jgi:hypothetical protein
VVKITTHLIVYLALGSAEKLKLITKLDVEATIISDLFKNYLIKIFGNKTNLQSL